MNHTTQPTPRLLIVDDEADLREILEVNLSALHYEVQTAASGEEAWGLLTSGARFDLMLLDVLMPGMSGFELAERLRAAGFGIPIIFLTALDAEHDLLRGFHAGGDDYIAKPFSLREVGARVAAVLKRTSATPSAAEGDVFTLGGLLIDWRRKCARRDGEEVLFSPKEFAILRLLVTHPGRIFSREDILSHVWRGEAIVMERTVDVHIARLRRKLGREGESLINRSGFGYSFDPAAV